jgi:hypothetical protein
MTHWSDEAKQRRRATLVAFKRFDRTDHGTRTCYVMGCKCDECRDAEAIYSRGRKQLRSGSTIPQSDGRIVE